MTQQAFKPMLINLLRQALIDQNAFFQQLPAAELETIGTPDYWSAKDHVAHMTFWRQRLTLRVQAIIHNEPPTTNHPQRTTHNEPPTEDLNSQQLNPLIFEEHRYSPWSAILTESDQAYANLISSTEQLTDEDLTAWGRFNWINGGKPLYTSYVGNWYEHTQSHLAQYLLDRHENARAVKIFEVWANRVVEANVPETLKGYLLYDLACFYATHTQLEKARPALQPAFTLYPALKEVALTDSDLVALRPDSSH